RHICVYYQSPPADWLHGSLAIRSATTVAKAPSNPDIEETVGGCAQPDPGHANVPDGIVTDDLYLTPPGTRVRLIAKPVFTEQFAMALDARSADPALLEALNTDIAGMKADGTMERLSHDAFGTGIEAP